MTPDSSLGTGVYYSQEDYAGILRRVAVITIDTAALLVIGTVLWITMATVFWNISPKIDPSGIFILSWFAFTWLYLVPLKRSCLRTLGYRLLGVKIVSTRGERPSLFVMTFRMLMWRFGPFNLLFDLLWLGADSEQQSLRDCYAGTYVVRNSAQPIGTAPVHLARYTGAGLSLVYPRVCRPKT